MSVLMMISIEIVRFGSLICVIFCRFMCKLKNVIVMCSSLCVEKLMLVV